MVSYGSGREISSTFLPIAVVGQYSRAARRGTNAFGGIRARDKDRVTRFSLNQTMNQRAANLPRLLSLLPRNGLDATVFQARWLTKNLPVPSPLAPAPLDQACYYRVTKVNLTHNSTGKLSAKAWGIKYWKGPHLLLTASSSSSIQARGSPPSRRSTSRSRAHSSTHGPPRAFRQRSSRQRPHPSPLQMHDPSRSVPLQNFHFLILLSRSSSSSSVLSFLLPFWSSSATTRFPNDENATAIFRVIIEPLQ